MVSQYTVTELAPAVVVCIDHNAILNVVVETALTVTKYCPAILLADVGPIVRITIGVPV